ncbi:MAG TPA: SIMPL domain-containing protein, partial [Acidimicrobiales bacterium]|nr:SIMPL domain-containing protein [Acidimicrobiales bacterium]
MEEPTAPPPPPRANHRATAVWVLVLVVAAAGVAVTLASRPSAARRTVTVTGTGTVQGAPDTMSVDVGVQTTAASASAALAQNNVDMGRLESALLAHGLTKAGLQTSNLAIYPNTNGRGQVTGFTVNDTLTATTHRLDEAGAALDAAARAVGNDVQLNGVSFSISSQSRLLGLARRAAVRNAHAAALEVTSASATSLGAPLSIIDQESQSSPIVYG